MHRLTPDLWLLPLAGDKVCDKVANHAHISYFSLRQSCIVSASEVIIFVHRPGHLNLLSRLVMKFYIYASMSAAPLQVCYEERELTFRVFSKVHDI